MGRYSDISRATSGIVQTALLGGYMPAIGVPKVDTVGCKDCKNGCLVDQRIACQYILKHGHMRGCPGGSMCTMFEPARECGRKAGEIDPSVKQHGNEHPAVVKKEKVAV